MSRSQLPMVVEFKWNDRLNRWDATPLVHSCPLSPDGVPCSVDHVSATPDLHANSSIGVRRMWDSQGEWVGMPK